MRHLLLVIALFGAGLVPARAADSPAQMVTGKRSIEQLLRIPKGMRPGRYTLHCGVLIGTSGWVLLWMKLQIDEQGQMTSCTIINNTNAPAWWVDAVNEAAKQMRFIPGYHDGKPVPMLFVQPMLWRY